MYIACYMVSIFIFHSMAIKLLTLHISSLFRLQKSSVSAIAKKMLQGLKQRFEYIQIHQLPNLIHYL